MLAQNEIAHSRLLVGPEPRCAGRAPVEQHGDATAPGPFLHPHHQLVAAGGGTPVHAAQVVALPVLAHDRVVLALTGTQPDRAVVAGALAGTAGQTGEPHDPRDHHDPAVRGEFAFELGEAERVGDATAQRADVVDAAHRRAQLIAQTHGVAAAQPLDHEPGTPTQHVRDAVLQQQAAGRDSAGGVDLQHHVGRLTGLHAWRDHGAPGGKADPRCGGQGRAEQR